jgi:sugar phosphate isomerase/epimerase
MELKFAARLNSFNARPDLYWDQNYRPTVFDLLERASTVSGLHCIELNYPQHFIGHDPYVVLRKAKELGLEVTGLNMRYDNPVFQEGGLTHPRLAIRKQAIELTKDAVRFAAENGIEHVVVWPGTDGFDYAFQANYKDIWTWVVEGIREIANTDPSVKVSIEYKPMEPRRRALLSNIGTTLLAIKSAGSPNLGVTLDFCHLLMAGDTPALAAVLALQEGKLYGIHLNDGYGQIDDGMMVGSVNPWATLELIYYLQTYQYQGVIYFDTFPSYENPVEECAANIRMTQKLWDISYALNSEDLLQIQAKHDSVKAHELIGKLLKEGTACERRCDWQHPL